MGTKRPQNKCSTCGKTWHPRGSDLSTKCPGCNSTNVVKTVRKTGGSGCLRGVLGSFVIVVILLNLKSLANDPKKSLPEKSDPIVAVKEIGNNKTQGPSFDCKKAKSEAEKIICSDFELSKLDIELSSIFRKAKLAAVDFQTFNQQTEAALKWREDNCRDKECLVNWYAERKVALLNLH